MGDRVVANKPMNIQNVITEEDKQGIADAVIETFLSRLPDAEGVEF